MRLTTLRQQADAHSDGIWSAAWVPNSTALLTGSVDESVKLWDDGPEALSMVRSQPGHTLGVISVVANSAGTLAAVSSLDSYVRVWTISDGVSQAVMETAPTETWSIAFNPSPNVSQLATAGGTRGAVVIWRMDQGQVEAAAELQVPLVRDHPSSGRPAPPGGQ